MHIMPHNWARRGAGKTTNHQVEHSTGFITKLTETHSLISAVQ